MITSGEIRVDGIPNIHLAISYACAVGLTVPPKTSAPIVKDPDPWYAAKIPGESAQIPRLSIMSSFLAFSLCSRAEESENTHEVSPIKFNYSDLEMSSPLLLRSWEERETWDEVDKDNFRIFKIGSSLSHSKSRLITWAQSSRQLLSADGEWSTFGIFNRLQFCFTLIGTKKSWLHFRVRDERKKWIHD